MKHILLLQFRTDNTREHEQVCFHKFKNTSSPVEFDIVNIFDESIDWNAPDELLDGIHGVILAGSGELYLSGKREGRNGKDALAFENAMPLVHYVIEHDIPTLAICFGHQLVGEMLGSEVKRDAATAKAGTFPVSQTKNAAEDPIFAGVSQSFLANYAHKDSLSELPFGATLLASGELCPVAGFRYKKNIYSFQFHPEISHEESLKRREMNPSYYTPEDFFLRDLEPTPEAERILHNFIRLVVPSV